MIKCLLCDTELENRDYLHIHYRYAHAKNINQSMLVMEEYVFRLQEQLMGIKNEH